MLLKMFSNNNLLQGHNHRLTLTGHLILATLTNHIVLLPFQHTTNPSPTPLTVALLTLNNFVKASDFVM